ncbi:hypothetical protein [Actinomadura rugatobispora]|uniref:Uncharacterized protein n=1 Tax=Actinomadura rugatobispora TaxID=1994 RepID=A0ABW1AEZ7_9ACTN|nr:hypothetical protein GCM10010200_025110 [Actinomadura rugatobispora]
MISLDVRARLPVIGAVRLGSYVFRPFGIDALFTQSRPRAPGEAVKWDVQ